MAAANNFAPAIKPLVKLAAEGSITLAELAACGYLAAIEASRAAPIDANLRDDPRDILRNILILGLNPRDAVARVVPCKPIHASRLLGDALEELAAAMVSTTRHGFLGSASWLFLMNAAFRRAHG